MMNSQWRKIVGGGVFGDLFFCLTPLPLAISFALFLMVIPVSFEEYLHRHYKLSHQKMKESSVYFNEVLYLESSNRLDTTALNLHIQPETIKLLYSVSC